MTALARTILFLSAYTPAFVLLAWRAIATNSTLSVALLTFSALVVLLTWRLIVVLRQGASLRAVVVRAESRSGDIAGFLLGYVLPFIVADYSDISSVAMLGALFALLGVVTVRGHLTHLNPLLLLGGLNVWHLRVQYRDAGQPTAAELADGDSHPVTVISDDLDVTERTVLWISKADGPVWFAAKGDPHG